ncbi:MAG: ABC transporter permease [Anaerolineae bacterium]|nr:ABC transporter permease [Anaerolineae bacterium]
MSSSIPEAKARPGASLARFIQFREFNVLIAFLLLCLFFYVQRPDTFLKPQNIAVIMRFVATFGMLAIGEVLIIITCGIDLSVGSLVALTGVIGSWLIIHGLETLNIPPFAIIPAIIITLIVGVLFGLWHGLVVTRLNIPPFIITLGTWLIARGLAALITRGYPIVYPVDSPFLALGQGDLNSVLFEPLLGENHAFAGTVIGAIPISFIIFLTMAAIAWVILGYSKLGYRIYATGGNLEAARLSGINVNRVRLFCYATSGTMAALTGVLLASRLGQGTPTVGSAYELWAIAASVIGGTSLFGGEGTILGAALGASIIGVMQNGMILLNTSSYHQDVILGLVLVIAVTYDTLRRRIRD